MILICLNQSYHKISTLRYIIFVLFLDINPNPSIVARKVFKYQQYSNRISSVLSYCFSSVQVVYSCTRQSINILHFQWPKLPPFDCLLIFLLKLLGKKIVYTLHNVIPHDTSHLSFFDLIILRLVDNISVHSQYAKSLLLRKYPFLYPKIFISPHGLIPFQGNSTPCTEYEKLPDRVKLASSKFIFIGSDHPYKGLSTLLESWQKLSTIHKSDAALFVIGKTGYSINCQNHYALSSKDESIYFTNTYASESLIHTLLLSSKCVILPHKFVTQSGVLYSVLPYRRKLILNSISSFLDAANNSEISNYTFFENNDSDDLARKIIDVIVHQEYDHYDSDNLDLQTTALCSWNASASLTCNIYKQLTKDI